MGFECPVPIQDYDTVTMAHGGGGKVTQRLIEQVLLPTLDNPALRELNDGAVVAWNHDTLAFSTDSYVIHPPFFPGGDIGSLAVHGTTNDLAVAGAKPLYLTLNAFIEEGFEIAVLDRIVASLARAARESGVRITAGDTKVLRRGEGGGAGIGQPGLDQPVGDELFQVGAGAGLHPRRDFLGEEFNQKIRHQFRLSGTGGQFSGTGLPSKTTSPQALIWCQA